MRLLTGNVKDWGAVVGGGGQKENGKPPPPLATSHICMTSSIGLCAPTGK